MSSAFYPLGMKTYNIHVPQGGYKTWKGRGLYSNPVGVTSGNLRPLTNKDPANDAPSKFGLPRPIKQYRRGTSIPVPCPNPESSNFPADLNYYYYSNRQVKSSVRDNMVSQMLDTPGRFIVKNNEPSTTSIYNNGLIDDCKTCNGIGIVSGWYPINNLTEKPQPNVTNPLLCCNQQRKAIQRVLPASTLLKKNYYTTTYQYLFNRCQTYDQRAFNFVRGNVDPSLYNNPLVTAAEVELSKPGDPLSYGNLDVANCNPNSEITTAANCIVIERIASILISENIITQEEYETYNSLNTFTILSFIQFLKTLPNKSKVDLALVIATRILADPYNGALINGPTNPKGCSVVQYKPNNPQFAQQGAVSSSTRILKLNVTTIEKNAASIQKNRNPNLSNQLTVGEFPATSYIYKNKAPVCNPAVYARNGNPRICNNSTNDISNTNLNPVATFNYTVNQLSDMTAVVNH